MLRPRRSRQVGYGAKLQLEALYGRSYIVNYPVPRR